MLRLAYYEAVERGEPRQIKAFVKAGGDTPNLLLKRKYGKRALERLHCELMDLNPSAGRSLEAPDVWSGTYMFPADSWF
jgi:hypothetical protein